MDPEGPTPSPRTALLAGVIFEGGLALAAMGLGALLGVSPLATLHLDPRDAATGAAVALPLIGAFVLFLRSGARPLTAIRDALDRHLLPVLRSASVIDLFALSALAGIGEEMFFRGVLQAALGGFAGTIAGLAVASLLFGLAHAITRTYVAVAALVGLLLGGLWLVTDNLLAPMVAHGLYDFVALAIYVRDARRRLPER